MSRVEGLPWSDFRGGLNLRSDPFTLNPTESPNMLNVDMDVRAGIRSRKGWEAAHSGALGALGAVTRLHDWSRSNGSDMLVAATDAGKVAYSSGGADFVEVSDGGSLGVAADVHGAEFVHWRDNLYIFGGMDGKVHRWDGVGLATELSLNGASWQDDYTAPGSNQAVAANYACAYSGYMVVAGTKENGVEFPNRVRFSHPNQPDAWHSEDTFDIEHGGDRITGLIPFSDHVLVLKTESVWAIYGYDASSFARSQLAGDTGCPHRNAVCVGLDSAFFWSPGSQQGVIEYSPGNGFRNISAALSPEVDGASWNTTDLDSLCLGWENRRVWLGAPYARNDGAAPSVPETVFVYEPRLEAWTCYQGADGNGVGPFASGSGAFAYAYGSDRVVALDELTSGQDDLAGTGGVYFPTEYTTAWIHGGTPDQRKSWRRPTYMVTEASGVYTLVVDVFHNGEESRVRSRHSVEVETGSDNAQWGSFQWGDGTKWGVAPSGFHKERGGTLGSADSVQLKFSCSGPMWGLNMIEMKLRPRRYR